MITPEMQESKPATPATTFAKAPQQKYDDNYSEYSDHYDGEPKRPSSQQVESGEGSSELLSSKKKDAS
jgi:hypothetical protein